MESCKGGAAPSLFFFVFFFLCVCVFCCCYLSLTFVCPWAPARGPLIPPFQLYYFLALLLLAAPLWRAVRKKRQFLSLFGICNALSSYARPFLLVRSGQRKGVERRKHTRTHTGRERSACSAASPDELRCDCRTSEVWLRKKRGYFSKSHFLFLSSFIYLF